MGVLVADRFFCAAETPPAAVFGARRPPAELVAVDFATTRRVRMRVEAAGTKREQLLWNERSTRRLAAGAILDFGLIGEAARFEVMPLELRACERPVLGIRADVADWMEHSRPSSSRILQVGELPSPRALRMRGFVPCALDLLRLPSASAAMLAVLARRSVVVLAWRAAPAAVAMAFLELRTRGARDVCALVEHTRKDRLVMHAAEARPAYGPRPAIGDPRACALLSEGDRLEARGRHAGAERAWRAAAAAFDRRGDQRRSGEALTRLGRLLLARGRAADAKTAFERAAEHFSTIADPLAIEASVLMGVAQTDLSQLIEAEATGRAAYSAASAAGDTRLIALAAIALARTVLWQDRPADARALVDAVLAPQDPEMSTRYWCLAARLAANEGRLREARAAIGRARRQIGSDAPHLEAQVRRCEAEMQVLVGDLDAVILHVRAGLDAARKARRPLEAVRHRLVLVEGSIAAGRLPVARTSARHLSSIRAAVVPPLLAAQIQGVLRRAESESGTEVPRGAQIAVARESPAAFVVTASPPPGVLAGMQEILACCHQAEDEIEALHRAAAEVRRHTHATGAGIYGGRGPDLSPLGVAGPSSLLLARRAFDIGQPVGPETTDGWIEAAVPFGFLGRTAGAVAIRWTADGPEETARALEFAAAAGTACAPLVCVVVERTRPSAVAAAPFDIVGTSTAIEEVRRAVLCAAKAPFAVLIEGESGSGKELVARAIHRAGSRRGRAFSALNCAAMPEDLIDVELFGHAKGAFTGAVAEHMGLFESADAGTVFLDEVGELSARAQAKLLRVLQEGEVRRIGETFTRAFDVRLVAATNRPLRAEAEAGRFRQDLLYRLDVIRIAVPPLRDRPEDIPLLAAQFWQKAAERMGSRAVLGRAVMAALARYDWPGNVRELQNVLAALAVSAPARGLVGPAHLPAAIGRAAHIAVHEPLERARVAFEQRYVRAALAKTGGHRGETAAALGVSRQGLAKLMQRLRLDA